MLRVFKSPADRTLAILGAALAASALVVVATTSGGQAEGAGPPPSRSVATANRVVIQGFKFAPSATTVSVGTKITWTNMDGAPHTATAGVSPTSSGLFDTGTINRDKTVSVVLKKPGTFTYFCALHPFMKGTVTVK